MHSEALQLERTATHVLLPAAIFADAGLPPGATLPSSEEADQALSVRLTVAGFSLPPVELRVGGRLFVGRHPCNDLVLEDSSISRLHAVIHWPRGARRPFLEDKGSTNGTKIDGEKVSHRQPLVGGEEIVFGQGQRIGVELLHAGTPSPCLVAGDDDGLRLLGAWSDYQFMRAVEPKTLQVALLETELNGLTGTFRVWGGSLIASLTFCLGRIIAAVSNAGQGVEVVDKLLTVGQVQCSFEATFAPVESRLDVSVKDRLLHQSKATRQANLSDLRQAAGAT